MWRTTCPEGSIPWAEFVKIIDVTIHFCISFKYHTSWVCSTCALHTKALRHIGQFLDVQTVNACTGKFYVACWCCVELCIRHDALPWPVDLGLRQRSTSTRGPGSQAMIYLDPSTWVSGNALPWPVDLGLSNALPLPVDLGLRQWSTSTWVSGNALPWPVDLGLRQCCTSTREPGSQATLYLDLWTWVSGNALPRPVDLGLRQQSTSTSGPGSQAMLYLDLWTWVSGNALHRAVDLGLRQRSTSTCGPGPRQRSTSTRGPGSQATLFIDP